VTCPGCGRNFAVRDRFAGQKAVCGCGRTQVIPAEAPRAGGGALLDSPALLGFAVALLVVSLAVGGGVVVWVAAGRPPGEAAADATPAAKNEEDKQPRGEAGPAPPRKEEPKQPAGGAGAGPSAPRAAAMTERQLYERLLKSVVWIAHVQGESLHSGSGAVVHAGRRLIVTNWHVVREVPLEGKVMILFPSWREKELITDKKHYLGLLRDKAHLTATVLAKNESIDLAILQLDRPALPAGVRAVPFARQHAEPGDRLVSVGNPGSSRGLWVLASGVVRARVPEIRRNQRIRKENGEVETVSLPWVQGTCLETTLPINRGDSGSLVVNDRGQAVAVNFGGNDAEQLMQFAIDRNIVLSYLKAAGVKEEEVLAGDSAAPAGPALRALIGQVGDPNPEVCRKGVEALGGVDPDDARPAVPALTRALQTHEKDEDLLRRITAELGRIGPPAAEDLDCLLPVVKHPSARARLYAVDALARLGAGAKNGIPVLVQALKDRDADIRKKAAAVLRDLGPTARPKAFRVLLTSASDEDEEVARAAFHALFELGKLTAAELDLLVEAVNDEKRRAFVRRFAAYRLGEQGSEAARAVPALTRVLEHDKDAALVKIAAAALGQIGGRGKETLDALLRVVLSGAQEDARLAALDALAALDLSVLSTGKMLERIDPEADPSPKVRLRVAHWLDVRLGTLKSDQLAELRPLLRHKDPKIVGIGLRYIVRRKQGAVLIADLVALVQHADVKVCKLSLTALAALGEDAKAAVPGLLRAFDAVAGQPGGRERQVRLAVVLVGVSKADEKVQEKALPLLVASLHPDHLAVGGENLHRPIHKALVSVGQPAVDAIFKGFEEFGSRKGRDNSTHRTNLYLALEGLAGACKSKENAARLKPLWVKEGRGYEDTRNAAARALRAMDPG
jgi:S1-C subfamily serine protease